MFLLDLSGSPFFSGTTVGSGKGLSDLISYVHKVGSHSFRAGSKVSSSNSTSWLYYIPQTCALSTCQPASKSWSQTCSCYTSTDSLVPISRVSILRFIYLKSNFTKLLKVPPSNLAIYFLSGHFATLLTFLLSKSTPT